MRRDIALPVLLVAAVLVVWHGMILSLPHIHADPTVPQEAVSCSAALAGAQVVHLHHAGRTLPAHPCLACLAGTTFAVASSWVRLVGAGETVADRTTPHRSCRTTFHAHLPGLRAPPDRFGV
jgi:hypothetical protein